MKIIRKTWLWLMAAVALTLAASCGRDSNDSVSALLRSVPSSSSMVTVFNTGRLLDDLGCKSDGDNVKRSATAQALLDTIRARGGSLAVQMMLDDKTGVSRESVVAFSDAYATYLTGLVDDTALFKEWVAGKTGAEFADNNGIETSANVAVKGSQFWICVSRPRDIDQTAVGTYSSLAEAQSFASNEASKKLEDAAHDVLYWGDINGMLKNLVNGGFSQQTGIRVVMGMLFEDASYSLGTLDLDKDKFMSVSSILNTKGKTARYLLPDSKIDVATVAGLGEKSEFLVAMGYPKELTAKIKQLSGSLGGALPENILSALGPIDGTVALSIDDYGKNRVSGVITTDGSAATALTGFLSTVGNVEKEGKLIKYTNNTGDVTEDKELLPASDQFDLKSAAEKIKGSCLGFVLSASSDMVGGKLRDTAVKPGLVYGGFYSVDKGLEFRLDATTGDGGNMASYIVEEFLSNN